MSEKPTPETDAAAYSTTYNNGTWAGDKQQVVDSEFSRELERQRDELDHNLGELLALIHRDGGHHRANVGNDQATREAIDKWNARGALIDELAEALRELVRQIDRGWDRSEPQATAVMEGARALLARLDAKKQA